MSLYGNRRCALSVCLTVIVALSLSPVSADAQLGGLIRRATGIGDALEVKRAYDERKNASRVGGTWEIMYIFNGVDTTRAVARTFANPDIGMVHEGGFGRSSGERGHLLSSVSAPTLAQLPADWRSAGGNRRDYGGGPVFVYPMTTDTLAAERSYMIGMLVWLPASCFGGDESRQKEFNKRLERTFGGDMIDASGAVIRDGYNTRDLRHAQAVVRADSSVTMTARYRKKGDILLVVARRISTVTYSNEGKPGLLPGR